MIGTDPFGIGRGRFALVFAGQKGVQTEVHHHAVAGFFELDGERYLALVNNSWTDSGLFKIHTPKDGRLDRMNWNGTFTAVKAAHWDAFYTETETENIGGDWLAPGQMKVYHI